MLSAIMAGVPGARWQDDDQLHLTLRFIGDVDRRLAEDIALAIANVRAAPIAIALSGVGDFAKLGRSNALWAGVTPHDALTTLHKKVDQAMVRLGLPPEGRAYLPHITVARLPRSAGAAPEIAAFLAAQAGLSSAPFTLSHLMLFESHLTGDGARYETVGRWPLA